MQSLSILVLTASLSALGQCQLDASVLLQKDVFEHKGPNLEREEAISAVMAMNKTFKELQLEPNIEVLIRNIDKALNHSTKVPLAFEKYIKVISDKLDAYDALVKEQTATFLAELEKPGGSASKAIYTYLDTGFRAFHDNAQVAADNFDKLVRSFPLSMQSKLEGASRKMLKAPKLPASVNESIAVGDAAACSALQKTMLSLKKLQKTFTTEVAVLKQTKEMLPYLDMVFPDADDLYVPETTKSTITKLINLTYRQGTSAQSGTAKAIESVTSAAKEKMSCDVIASEAA